MKDPAFLLYYKDFESDTADWEPDAVGWYMRLLCFQAGNGYVPSSHEEMAQVARVKFSQYTIFCDRLATRLASKFIPLSEGKLYNPFLQKVQDDRKKGAVKKSVLAVFGNLIRHTVLSKSEEISVKTAFSEKKMLDVFCEINNEEKRKEAIIEFFNTEIIIATEVAKRPLIEDETVIEDVIENEGKGGMGEKPKEPKQKKESTIPPYEEFELYAKEKEPTVSLHALKNKYDAWIENGWKDGNNQKITNWKVKLLNTMPFIAKNTDNGKSNSGNKTGYKFDLNRAITAATGGNK